MNSKNPLSRTRFQESADTRAQLAAPMTHSPALGSAVLCAAAMAEVAQ